MGINYLSIHLKNAWDHIRRNPFQSFSTFFALAINFFMVSVLAILVYSSTSLLKYFESRPQVIAFLKDEASEEEVSNLFSILSQNPKIKKVKYVSKEEAVEIYKKATEDNPLLSELISPSIFPASIEFSLNDLSFADEVISSLKQEKIVDSVGFTANIGGEKNISDVVGRLRTFTWYIRIIGFSLLLLFSLVSFLVLFVMVGLRISTRRQEVEVLRLIGATPSFIRSPLILESIIYGLAGVLGGWLFCFLLMLYISPTLINYFGDLPILPRSMNEFLLLFATLLLAEIVFGVFLSLAGSLLAISRAKRVK